MQDSTKIKTQLITKFSVPNIYTVNFVSLVSKICEHHWVTSRFRVSFLMKNFSSNFWFTTTCCTLHRNVWFYELWKTSASAFILLSPNQRRYLGYLWQIWILHIWKSKLRKMSKRMVMKTQKIKSFIVVFWQILIKPIENDCIDDDGNWRCVKSMKGYQVCMAQI